MPVGDDERARNRVLSAQASARSLLPDCGGAIGQLAISVVPQCFTDHDTGRALLAALGSFVATLPDAVALAILAVPETRAELDRWLDRIRPRCRIDVVPANFHAKASTIEFWTQDSFLVAQDGDYLTPASENPTRHAQWLGRALGKALHAQPFHLAGGNLLVGPDFKLIGCDDLPSDPKPRAEMTAALHYVDSRQVFEVGYRLGEGRFDAVSVPPRGSGIDPYRMRQYGGHIDRTIAVTGLTRAGRPLLVVARAVRASAAAEEELRPVADRLDRTARSLTELGFAVERNEVPFVPALGKVQLRPRSYNNVLLENQIRPGRHRPLVWVPQFADAEAALAPFDAANLALWRDLGFDPVPAPGWSKLAIHSGALRCATKVLARQQWLPDDARQAPS